MNGFGKIFRTFLSYYATFFAKMAERKVVPFDEFYYQLKLMYLFLLHPVYFDDILIATETEEEHDQIVQQATIQT
jgi:hypothetical protein